MHLLTEHQATHMHGHNTENQLLRLFQSISNGFQQSLMQPIQLALIDYSWAHDKVWRYALLRKMSQRDVLSNMVRWIQVWLSNMLTCMTLDGVRSRTVILKQSVHGLVMSSLLFLFYIDDQVSTVKTPQITFLAGDVAVLVHDTDLGRATAKLQKYLDATTSTSWKMELPVKKSECFYFATNTQEVKWHTASCLNGQQIKYDQNQKFLGMTYDRQLTFGSHASIVGSKVKQQSGTLWCLASNLSYG